MSLVSGNTFGATVWSDTRREYPMLPEVSPIQKCPHCQKYYFIEQAKSEYSNEDNSYCFELGNLSYSELVAAYNQFSGLSLTKMQRWILNHEIFMAYNDCFRRKQKSEASAPSISDKNLYTKIIDELLAGIDKSRDFKLFYAELLRETNRFDEAQEVLASHNTEEDKWIVDAMMKHIKDGDSEPFLLVKNGEKQI